MLSNENGGLSAADIAAVMGNGGNGMGAWGADGAWWLVIIMLFALTGGNWGGFGNNAPGGMVVQNDVQRGFDQSALMNSISGLTTAVNNGFANAEVSRCNSQMNLTNLLNGISMQQQNSCYENRSAIADLKYTVATENCEDRAVVSNALRDIVENNSANTQALINSTNQGFQSIMDKICQLELDAKNDKIADLQRQVSDATRREEFASLKASLLQDNAVQTNVLENYLSPQAVPAYIVQNPNCCTQQYYNGCGRRMA